MDTRADHRIDPKASVASICEAIHRDYAKRAYAHFHAPRFAVLLKLVAEFAPPKCPRILDIGMSEFSDLLRDTFGVPVDTLDVEHDSIGPKGQQFQFDLTETERPEAWRMDLGTYDVIVMAEVIEHVYASPEHQLRYLRSLLVPGGVVIVQTPNAAAFQKRVKLLLGVNPYEKFRLKEKWGGHVREYTRKELCSYAASTEFEVERTVMGGYFDTRYKGYEGRTKGHLEATVTNWINSGVPGPLRPGITMVLRSSHRAYAM